MSGDDFEWPTGWDFSPYQHWIELFSWSGFNWKNFTFVALELEYADATRPAGYFQIHVGLLGLGAYITRWGQKPSPVAPVTR